MSKPFSITRQTTNKTGHFVGGRGESHQTVTIVFHHKKGQVIVTQIQEYDKRPFYDAWEYQEIQQVRLFQLDTSLWICVTIKEDCEWIGGPIYSHQYIKSVDQGQTWEKDTGTEWLTNQDNAELLDSVQCP